MRMTVNIADDVVESARELAKNEQKSLDEFVADLVKERVGTALPTTRNGVPLIKRKATGCIVTPEFVNELRDADP